MSRARIVAQMAGLLILLGRPVAAADGGDLSRDPRLDAEVSLAEKDRPLGELLAALGREIQVPLRASRDTADDKATLFLDDRPAAEVMALLARHLDFQWVRSGTSYELIQSEESRAREAELRARDMEAQLGAITAAMERRPPLEGTPRRWLEERERELAARLASEELEETERGRLEEERSVVVRTLHPGRLAARLIFRSLALAQVRQLLEGRDLWLSTADGTLSPALADRVRQAEIEAARLPGWREFFQTLGGERWPPGETEVVLRLFDSLHTLSGPPTRGEPHFSLLFLIPVGSEEEGRLHALVGWSAEGRRPLPEPLPPTEMDDRELIADCRLRIADLGAEPGSRSSLVPLSRVAKALHGATGLQIVADSFTRARVEVGKIAPAGGGARPLVQLLDRLANELDATWRKEGDVLFFRSRTWYHGRVEEAPERVLRPWRERVRRQGAATLDDHAALAAALTDAQARGLQLYWDWYFEGTPARSPTSDCGGFYGNRHPLRLWASLTPFQRRRLLRGEVLPVAGMSLRQRGLFAAALESSELGLFTVPVRRPATPREIATGGFGYQPPRSAEAVAHTFSFYLAGGREAARELELYGPTLIGQREAGEP